MKFHNLKRSRWDSNPVNVHQKLLNYQVGGRHTVVHERHLGAGWYKKFAAQRNEILPG